METALTHLPHAIGTQCVVHYTTQCVVHSITQCVVHNITQCVVHNITQCVVRNRQREAPITRRPGEQDPFGKFATETRKFLRVAEKRYDLK